MAGLLLLLFSAWLAGASPATAQGPDNRVGLVVQFGNGAVFSQCYAYTPGMTGLDLLRRAGINAAVEYSSMGALVCRMSAPELGADGCDYPRDDCLCQARSLPWRYWAYWRWQGNDWAYSDRGAAGRQLQPGSVDGWAWGVGTTDFGARPPRLAFNDVCTPPTATPPPPPPTATPGPQPVVAPPTATPPPTTTPPPTATTPPTATLAPTATSTADISSGGPTATPLPTATPASVALASPEATATPAFTATRTPAIQSVAAATSALAPTTPTAQPGPASSAEPSPTPSSATTIAPRPSRAPTLAATATSLPTTTPRAASVVDLSRLTPIATGAVGSGSDSSGPPVGYALFALIVLGLVGVLVVRQRRGE